MEDFVMANLLMDTLGEAELENAYSPSPRRIFPQPEDAFELPEHLFVKNYRLPKVLVHELINLLEPVIVPTTQYDITRKVLSALHFFGHGSYQSPVGEHLMSSMSQPSISRCLNEVVEALNHPTIFNQWVHFPRNFQELNNIVRGFYDEYGFPGIVGAIDCTHVAIVSPPFYLDERSYVNRKGYHSINTQLICDANLNILNVNALFPGSSHDCHIWNNSQVSTLMETLHRNGHNNYHLIGDSGYALRTWCLTPIPEPPSTTPEERYNQALKKARSTIERCNGVIKGRFRCLLKDRVLHYLPTKATKIINAVAVLHNMCVKRNFDLTDNVNYTEEQLGIIPASYNSDISSSSSRVNILLQNARAKQQMIVQNYFNE